MPEKKICILTHTPIANDSRVIKTIATLIEMGFSLWVFYPGLDGQKDIKYLKQADLNLCPVKKRNSFFRQLLRHTFFPLEFNYFAQEVRNQHVSFDYVYVNDLPLLNAGRLVKKSNPGCRLIYDSHEIFNETVNQFFSNPSSFFKSILFRILINIMRRSGSFLEGKFVKNVDLFITVNESLKNYFEKKYDVSGVQVMMNCPSSKQCQQDLTNVDYKKMYEWEGNSRIFLYQGAWNKGRGLELLIRVFKETPREFKLVIIGRGILEKTLEDLIKKNNIQEKVKLHGFVPQDKLPAYTKAADVGLNLLEPFNLSKAMASPNKLFEYIHAGIPVIASRTKENQIVFDEFDIGLLVENNVNSILKALFFFQDPEKIKEKTKFHYKAKTKYHWETQVKGLKKFLK